MADPPTPNAPVIQGSTYTGLPTGWQRLFDYRAGLHADERVAIYQGPALTLDDAIEALEDELSPTSIDPSVSPGSAVASIRVKYGGAGTGGNIPAGDAREPVYQITPLRVSVDLKGYPSPALKAVAKYFPEIDAAILAGDMEKVKELVKNKEAAEQYARLRISGVTSFEQTGFVLSATRYYKTPPTISSSEYSNIGTVGAWGSIQTGGVSIPDYVKEPKYQLWDGTNRSYEWRFVGVSPTISPTRYASAVTWTYEGLYFYSAWLYQGGTWEPASL